MKKIAHAYRTAWTAGLEGQPLPESTGKFLGRIAAIGHNRGTKIAGDVVREQAAGVGRAHETMRAAMAEAHGHNRTALAIIDTIARIPNEAGSGFPDRNPILTFPQVSERGDRTYTWEVTLQPAESLSRLRDGVWPLRAGANQFPSVATVHNFKPGKSQTIPVDRATIFVSAPLDASGRFGPASTNIVINDYPNRPTTGSALASEVHFGIYRDGKPSFDVQQTEPQTGPELIQLYDTYVDAGNFLEGVLHAAQETARLSQQTPQA